MAFTVNVPGGLHQLLITRNRSLELIEWDKLVDGERKRGKAPGFDAQTSTRVEIRNDLRMMYSLFLSVASSVREVLGREDLGFTKTEVAAWRRKLQRLEDEVCELRVGERVLSC